MTLACPLGWLEGREVERGDQGDGCHSELREELLFHLIEANHVDFYMCIISKLPIHLSC